MVQSKGKKSSVNFKYYALENWLLSLTSNRLSSTAGHFPAKASLASLDLYGMRCKLCRRGRQEGRVVPLLYFILYYCCSVNFKTAEKWFTRHLERCGNYRKSFFSCVWSGLSIMDSTPSPTSAPSAPTSTPNARALHARPAFFVICLHLFTTRP